MLFLICDVFWLEILPYYFCAFEKADKIRNKLKNRILILKMSYEKEGKIGGDDQESTDVEH